MILIFIDLNICWDNYINLGVNRLPPINIRYLYSYYWPRNWVKEKVNKIIIKKKYKKNNQIIFIFWLKNNGWPNCLQKWPKIFPFLSIIASMVLFVFKSTTDLFVYTLLFLFFWLFNLNNWAFVHDAWSNDCCSWFCFWNLFSLLIDKANTIRP